MDAPALLDRVGHDRRLLAELLELFDEEVPRVLHALRSALEREDAVWLRRTAHALKSVVGNFCAMAAVGLTLDLERAGASGDLNAARGLLPALEQELRRVHDAVSALVR